MSLADHAANLPEVQGPWHWRPGSKAAAMPDQGLGRGATRWWHTDTNLADQDARALLGDEQFRWKDASQQNFGLFRAAQTRVLRMARVHDDQDGNRSVVPVTLMCDGSTLVTAGEFPQVFDDHLERIGSVWADGAHCFRTAGDLGLLVLEELLLDVTRVRRELARELDAINSAFLASVKEGNVLAVLDEDDLPSVTSQLLRLRQQVARLYEALEVVNVPGMSRSSARVWFPAVTSMDEAENVDDLLDRSLRGLESLRSQVAESIGMCASVAGTEQSLQFDKLQVYIAGVGAFVIWPSLIFAFFGANTDLPGRDRTSGLLLMLVVSFLGVAFLLACIGLWVSRRRRRRPSAATTSIDPVALEGSDGKLERR